MTHAMLAKSPADCAALAAEAAQLFDAGRYAEAAARYDALIALGWDGTAAVIRRADCALRTGAPDAALVHLATIAPDRYGWADHVRASALLALGDVEPALALARDLVRAQPREAAFVRQLCTTLHAAGDELELARAQSLLTNLPEPQALEVRLHCALLRRAHGEIAALYCAQHDPGSAAIDATVAQALSALRARQTPDQTARTLDAFARRAHHGALVWDALVLSAIAIDDAARTRDLLQRAEAAHGRRMAATRLEVLCHSGETDAAAALAGDPALADCWPDSSIDTRIALLAECGAWAQIPDLVMGFLGERPDRNIHPGSRQTLIAAVRRTHAHDALCRAIDAMAAPGPALQRVRGMLATDLAAMALAEDPAAPGPARDPRIAALARPIVTRPAIAAKVLICSDARYLIGAAVTLSSLLRGNAAALAPDALVACLADDVDATGRAALERIAAAHGIQLSILEAGAIAPEARDLRAHYGHFGPGDRLPRAAYLRLFALRHLIERGTRGRVLYLDSDTVIEPGIEALLRFDMAGQPLAARPENAADRHVQRARARLGLHQAYVNSGVFVADADHPAFSDRIAQAIALALDAPERLSFHDQCALNAAFDRATAALPDRANAFIRAREAVPPCDVLIWHYLDRPKPWDPLYDGRAAHRWLTEWAALGAALPADVLRHLLRLSRMPA